MSCTLEGRSRGRRRDAHAARRIPRLVLILLLAALAACALLALAGRAPAPDASAAVIRVPDDYATIQEAVDNASVGDSLLIGAGTYNGTITSYRRVIIIGAGADRTVLDGMGSIALSIFASSTTVSGLSVTNATTSAGVWVEAHYCNIQNVRCSGNRVGIQLHQGRYNQLWNCTLTGNSKAGLLVGGGSEFNTFWNTRCDANGDGAGAIVEPVCNLNAFEGCSFDDQKAGIDVRGDRTLISNSTLRNNSQAAVVGSSVLGMSLNGCTVTGTRGSDAAIQVGGCSGVSVRDCDISRNLGTGGGIAMGLSDDVLIENCTLDGNSGTAMKLYSGQRVVVRNNTFVNGSEAGIYIAGNGALLTDNVFVSNTYGIHIDGSARDNDIFNNTVSRSLQSGIALSDAVRDNIVHNNTITGNGIGAPPYNDAITLIGSSGGPQYLEDNLVENNTFENNTRTFAFYNRYVRNNVFRYNIVHGGPSYVVYGSSNSSGNVFHHNNFLSGDHLVATPFLNDYFYSNTDKEGNYWYDYEARYPNAKRSGRIWDTPYKVDPGAEVYDHYPLAVPYDPHPPVADAGGNRTVPHGVEVTIDASASTDDRGIVSYVWDFYIQQDHFGQTACMTFNFAFPWLEVCTLILTVTDAWGNSDTDTAVITVVDLTPPVARAGLDVVVDMGTPFFLDGRFSSDNIEIVAYNWTIDPGGLDIRLSGYRVTATIDEPGDYLAVLNVSDAAGLWARSSVTVHVLDAARPVARAGPDIEVDVGQSFTLDGSASTDNVGIVSWEWSYEMNGMRIHISGERVVHVFQVPGVYVVLLLVTDARGLWATDALTVTVHDPVPPEADAGPDAVVDQHGSVALDGSGSTDNFRIVGWTWTFEYNGSVRTLTDETTTFRFHEAGEYTVTLTVEDAEGNQANDTMTVTVRDTTPPVADAGGDRTVDLGGVLRLDAGASTDNVGIASVVWALPEVAGVEPLGDNAFRFTALGTYLATLTVRDTAGHSASATIAVRVVDRTPPRADAGPDVTAIAGEAVVLNASASTDDAGIAGYLWRSDPAGLEATGRVVEWVPLEPGTYTVTLTVLDAALNRATDTLVVTVLTRNVTLQLGPFLDVDGAPVEGVRVRLTLDGTTVEGMTDAEGLVELAVLRRGLPGTAGVVATKDGWKRLGLELPLDAEGRPGATVPPMDREEEGRAGWAVPALLVALAVVVGLLLWWRSRHADGGSDR